MAEPNYKTGKQYKNPPRSEQKIQWSTRGMLVRHHTLMRRLAADKRTTMEEVHNRALEIGLGEIEREVFDQTVREEERG